MTQKHHVHPPVAVSPILTNKGIGSVVFPVSLKGQTIARNIHIEKILPIPRHAAIYWSACASKGDEVHQYEHRKI